MYNVDDTIVAVSSPSGAGRAIVRITGPATVEICQEIFTGFAQDGGAPSADSSRRRPEPELERTNRVLAGRVTVDEELQVDAVLYIFFAPRSYTGDDVAEIHMQGCPAVTQALMNSLFARGLRMAGPGEFTARAYMNGKVDLAQAEAVNEVVISSNTYQLAAAEKLLGGHLAELTVHVRAAMMDCLSLIEAGIDFGQEDIELVSPQEATERLNEIKAQLEQLLAGSINYETIVDLPAVGIAGAPNAGKSSLLNKLLGRKRSIVSGQRKTTRDVLTGLLTLAHCRCVLFDCAGLIDRADAILDALAQQAAIEALRNSSVVLFCVDIAKAEWAEDIAIRKLINTEAPIAVATKCDLLDEKTLAERLAELDHRFGIQFLATSAKTGAGLDQLADSLDSRIIEVAGGSAQADSLPFTETGGGSVALTARHKQAVIEAIQHVTESTNEFRAGNEEITAMMLRAAYQCVCDIEQQHVDEQILDSIFSRFCIGK
jgi:tRNA modification GTPase